MCFPSEQLFRWLSKYAIAQQANLPPRWLWVFQSVNWKVNGWKTTLHSSLRRDICLATTPTPDLWVCQNHHEVFTKYVSRSGKVAAAVWSCPLSQFYYYRRKISLDRLFGAVLGHGMNVTFQLFESYWGTVCMYRKSFWHFGIEGTLFCRMWQKYLSYYNLRTCCRKRKHVSLSRSTIDNAQYSWSKCLVISWVSC